MAVVYDTQPNIHAPVKYIVKKLLIYSKIMIFAQQGIFSVQDSIHTYLIIDE